MRDTTPFRIPEELLSSENLPTLPAVAMRILDLSRDEHADLDQYAEAISCDPALTAKLLRLSNSAVFGLVREVTTLRQATSILGLRTVNMMALGFSLARSFAKSGHGPLPLDEFWRRSLLGAVAGREFGRLTGTHLFDEAFLCGLLSQVGTLALAQTLATRYDEVVEVSEGWPTPEIEREVLGFDGAAVADALLRRWGMPDLIREGVVCWSGPERLATDASDRAQSLAQVVSLASAAVGVLRDEAKGEALSRLCGLASECDVAQDQWEAVLVTLEHRAKEVGELLDVELPEAPSHCEVLEEARNQMLRLGLEANVDLRRAETRVQRLKQEMRSVIDRSQRDELTGLRNRSAFEDELAAEIRKRTDRQMPGALGLVMVDIDHFKDINDHHGHQVGDAILHGVGEAILATSRESDTPARFGGDEFAVVVPGTTIEGLTAFGERLRDVLSKLKVPVGSKLFSVTVSVGAACLERAESAEAAGRLVATADEHLYRAKKSGRNRCCVHSALVESAET